MSRVGLQGVMRGYVGAEQKGAEQKHGADDEQRAEQSRGEQSRGEGSRAEGSRGEGSRADGRGEERQRGEQKKQAEVSEVGARVEQATYRAGNFGKRWGHTHTAQEMVVELCASGGPAGRCERGYGELH